jgi:hypothetical protein
MSVISDVGTFGRIQRKTFCWIIFLRFITFVFHISSARRRKFGKSRNWISHLHGYGRCFLNPFKLIHNQHIISCYTVCVPDNRFAKWIMFTYTGCPRRNVPDFGMVFIILKYTDITQNTYVQSWTVTEIMAREKCGLLWGSTHCTCQLTVLSISVLECGFILRLTLALTAYLQADKVDQTLRDTGSLPSVSCIVFGILRTTMTWVRMFL